MQKKTIALALVVCAMVVGFFALVIVRLFFVKLTRVPTGAMANTIVPGDQLVVTRWCFGDIQRGQIVIFRYPADSDSYVARIIGMPGESIQLRGDRVYINEQPLTGQRTKVKPIQMKY